MADTDLVDVVDEDDNVIDTVTRAEIRARGLRHRATYIVVRTTDDGIVVHRRAEWKDVNPGVWDIAFGGVVDAGEDWDAAAARELAEEAGISGSLRYLGPSTFVEAPGPLDAGTGVNGRVYDITHDGPYRFDDGEVTEARVVDRADLAAFIASHEMVNDSPTVVLPYLIPGLAD